MIRSLGGLLLIGASATSMSIGAQPPDAFAAALDAKWDYAKPALSEQILRAEAARWPPDSAQAAEAETQVARALALQRKFGAAQEVLDRVEARLGTLPAHVRIRYLLERGRTLNSSGAPQRAVPLFAEALATAAAERDEYYAVDAAHMLGIAAPSGERLGWNRKALSLAENAGDPRARGWRASLHHNLGWTYFDAGDAKAALEHWQEALSARETMGNAANLRVAKWTVARGLRAVGRLDAAEAMQKALLDELNRAGESDGYVYEELMEIELARGNASAAQPWAIRAHALLKDDPSLAEGDTPRLARLAKVATGDAAPATSSAAPSATPAAKP